LVRIGILHVVSDAKLKLDEGRSQRRRSLLSIDGVLMMEVITRMSKQSSDNIQSLLKVLILATIAGAAISSRLFSVIRFESIIHEFDP
jgi:hypothetical protein